MWPQVGKGSRGITERFGGLCGVLISEGVVKKMKYLENEEEGGARRLIVEVLNTSPQEFVTHVLGVSKG